MADPDIVLQDDHSVDEVANRLFFRLYQSSNLMHKAGTNAVEAFGITTQQWAVLGALARDQVQKDGMSVKLLMEYLMVSRQSLTAVLDRLQRAGLVERIRAADDGRVRHVRLTVNGRTTWGAMQGAIQAFYDAALSELSGEESYLLMRFLDRLCTGLAKL